jgi:3-dehydroquinate dehydratase/shikimate dehydrogenase
MSRENIQRVCVPVCVRRASELRRAVARASEVADLVEIRFDCLDEEQLAAALPLLPALLSEAPRQFILTFRPEDEGGRRALDARTRAGFWRAVSEQLGAVMLQQADAFADIELGLFESPHGAGLLEAVPRLKLICSHHDFGGTPSDLENIFERMTRTPARILKLAVRANDITDCAGVMRLLERARREGREMIAVAMGEAGLLTRVLAPARGAFLTYGSLDASQATAPGQIAARELRELYRIDEISERTMVTGLVGSPVAHSLSPHMHNAAFAARGLDGVYIPFEVADVDAFVRRMADPRTRELDWNLRGFSVTAPHKRAIMSHLDWVERRASEIGAVNTVLIEGKRLHGFNTDAEASVRPLEGLVKLGGARVAVVGAGGAARALLWALGERGARPAIFARNFEAAKELARDFDAQAAALEGASFDGFEVVVNTTPLGTRGVREGETPATAPQLRGARVAYDLVYNPPETRFLLEARAAGCETLGGLQMLVAQAAEQFRLWTGHAAPLEDMQAAAEKQMSDAGC